GGLLSVIKLNIARALRHADDKQMLEQLTQENYKLIEEIMQAARRAQRQLRPPMLDKTGFFAALKELCKDISDGHKINIDLPQETISLDLSPEKELQLYRIIKDLLRALAFS